jgi:glycopeptide antibiotics resistance protein
MMLIAFFKDQSLWQGIAFGLAFSFSVEVIQHRSKESN